MSDEIWLGRLTHYASEWFPKIEGYGTSDVISVVTPIIQRFQTSRDIKGSIGEIGVHHGRFFFALDALRREGEKSVAADVFGDQALNIDRSGLGDRGIFERHIANVSHDPDGVLIFQGDSLSIDFSEWLKEQSLRFRIFSVDGGHTVHHALSDMRIAESHLAHGGVIYLDDFCNPNFPGVTEAVYKYLAGAPSLVPVCTVSSKLIFTSISFAKPLRDQIRTDIRAIGRIVRTTNVAGHECLWLVPK